MAEAPSWLHIPAGAKDRADWLRRVEAQGLGPLAYRWLLAPADVRERLAAVYTESLGAWLRRREGLGGLLDVLSMPPAIPVVVLKGMALAVSLYKDPVLRPMHDIDVLVPVDRIEEAARRLHASGRRLVSVNRAHGFDVAHTYELFFDDMTSSPVLRLEVHLAPWSFLPRRAEAAMAWFWQHTEVVDWQQRPILVFDPTAQLLHLAAHLLHHGGSKQGLLLWSFDIHLLCSRRRSEIDWPEALRQAREMEWEAGLHAVLSDVAAAFGTRLPPEAASWLAQDPSKMAGVATMRNLSFPAISRTRSVMEALRHRSWRQRLRYFSFILFPHPAWMRARYPRVPGCLWLLLYPYRWLDLAVDAVSTVLGLRGGTMPRHDSAGQGRM